MRRIVTHKQPDLDAVVVAWLAQEFLFAGEACEVIFVARRLPVPIRDRADCIVDVGNCYDPNRLWFDHKPPAFQERNLTCATRLVWDHLIGLGRDVRYLEPLVTLTHEGDAKRQTRAVRTSRRDGPHAELARLRAVCRTDGEVYSGMLTWLNHRYGAVSVDPTVEPVAVGSDAGGGL